MLLDVIKDTFTHWMGRLHVLIQMYNATAFICLKFKQSSSLRKPGKKKHWKATKTWPADNTANVREILKYYSADFVLHKNINIMFIVKSSWSYLNKKILPHLCECLDNASFDFSGHWHKLCRQPHFLFIFVTFFYTATGPKSTSLSQLLCVWNPNRWSTTLDLQKLSNLLRLMISDSLILDLRKILHFIPPKPQCNVFSKFKPDIKMTPCKTISQ